MGALAAMDSGYRFFMTEVRPTLEVLKELEKRELLPPTTAKALRHARKVEDPAAKMRLLAELELSSLDIPLLRDARSRFSTGRPDRQDEMTAKAGQTIYEVRDHSSAGWRGAVVAPDDDCAWLVYFDAHDRYHSAGPTTINTKSKNNKLGPSALDRRIRGLERDIRQSSQARADLLGALVDSLIASSHTTARVVVETPTRFASAPLSVQVTEALDPEWDPVDAHEQVGDLVVRIGFGSSGSAIRDELIRTCVPFLQPDSSMRESIIRDELIVQILVTRASLMQLLATERPLLPVEDRKPPPPTTLHYTAKWSLTEAFVTGRAVRAVCGQWWVPVGDESTHAALPLCPECEQETPFAQTARDLILRLGKD